jgi:hypothetical protein
MYALLSDARNSWLSKEIHRVVRGLDAKFTTNENEYTGWIRHASRPTEFS